jgi:hypothetical protein
MAGAFIAPAVVLADIKLALPIECTLGQDCYIQQYVDHDPSSQYSDYRCNQLSYDGHKGTDFALPTYDDAMKNGVAVLAAATGTVVATRDGMDDVIYTQDRSAEVAGKECGNGLVIRHDNGWETQYCHLQKDSITVTTGQTVQSGDMLGLVGLSGKTQFPHVHLSVRHNGAVIDPFRPNGRTSCEPPHETLWTNLPQYQAGGILQIGFSNAVPSFDDVKNGKAQTPIDHNAPALVLFVHNFGTRAGDTRHLKITGPNGFSYDQTITFDKPQAMNMRAGGKRIRRGLAPGTYLGHATLVRDGDIISQSHTAITIN